MKTALFAAAALAVSTGATVLSAAPAFADSGYSSVHRPFGSRIHRTDRVRERLTHRHVYVPARRHYVAPEVRLAAAHLAAVRHRVWADGRVTLFEKIKLKAAENRYNRAVGLYR